MDLVAQVEKLMPNMPCACVASQYPIFNVWLCPVISGDECQRQRLSVTCPWENRGGYVWAAVESDLDRHVSCCVLRPQSEAIRLGAGDDRVASWPCQRVTLGADLGSPPVTLASTGCNPGPTPVMTTTRSQMWPSNISPDGCGFRLEKTLSPDPPQATWVCYPSCDSDQKPF